MANVQQPLNKAVNKLEGYDDKGRILAKGKDALLKFSKQFRLKRERRRYKVLDWKIFAYEKFTDHFNPDEGSFENEIILSYYETCENTYDTILNPTSSIEDYRKTLDRGGNFSHCLIQYQDPLTVQIDQFIEGEILDVRRTGSNFVTLAPYEALHLGIDPAEGIDPPQEDLDLSSLGPSLWAAMRPTKPVMDLGVAIAELRELPRAVKHGLDSLKSAVKVVENLKGLPEWLLAIQFGWLPLYRDIQKLFSLRGDVEKRLNFIKDNANKGLHRITPKKPWQPKVATVVIENWVSSEGFPPWAQLRFDQYPVDTDPDSIEDRFTARLECKTTTTEGGTGFFRYYWDGDIPNDNYLRARLAGLVLTERVAWEALPWTWLLDWFTNAGTVLSNMKDHLAETTVSPWAYAQRHIVREYKWTCSNGFVTCSITRVFDTKVREKIDPFGLAKDAGLTDMQQTILAALALTRV